MSDRMLMSDRMVFCLLADIKSYFGDPSGRLKWEYLVDHYRRIKAEWDEGRLKLEYLMEDCRKLKAERDEWKQKAERQAERIRVLEGATNHAGGVRK